MRARAIASSPPLATGSLGRVLAALLAATAACDDRAPTVDAAPSPQSSVPTVIGASSAPAPSASIDLVIVDLCKRAADIAVRSGETPRQEDLEACPRELAALRRDDATQYTCALEHIRSADDAAHLRRWTTACGDDPRRACLFLPEAPENQGKALSAVMPKVDLCTDRLRALRVDHGDAAYRCAMRCLVDLRKVTAVDRCFTGCI